MKLYKFTKVFLLILVLTWTAFPSPLEAHRFHTSLTRINYNAEDKNIEIIIQLFTHDLHQVLERRTKKRIDFEKTPDVDKIILSYLEEKFVLRDKQNENKKLRWVGKEVGADTTLVYLEIPSEEVIADYKLQNTIFFDAFKEQTNLVTVRYNGKKADLLFIAGDTFKEFTKSK